VRRGLLRTEDGRGLGKRSGAEAARTLVDRGLLDRALPDVIWRELRAAGFACEGCRRQVPFVALAELPRLACRQCGGALDVVEVEPESALGHSLATGAFAVPADLKRKVGPYEVHEELGRGCMGVVYRVRKPGLPRDFALKLMLGEQDAESVERFRQEAQLASKLDDRGVVPVFDVGEHGGRHYYVMDLCKGPTLAERIGAQGRLQEAEAARLVAKVARTIAMAHEQGVIHRDLKPANIMLEPGTHHPRVTDFGLARDVHRIRALTRTGDVLGTPYYMAPEQFGGERIDGRVDVWALGVIFYEALTGERPFTGATFQELGDVVCDQEPRPPRALVPQVTRGAEAVVLCALAKDPADRYLDAAALAEDLEAVARGESPSHASGVLPGGGSRQRDLVRGLGVAAFVAAVLASVFVATTLAPPPGSGGGGSAEGAAALERAARDRALRGALELADDPGASFDEADAALRRVGELSQELDSAGTGDLAHEVTLARGWLHLQRGRFEEGSALVQPLRGLAGAVGLEALQLEARFQEALGKRETAERFYDELARLDPDGARGRLARAARARLRWAPEEAAAHAREAAEAADGDPETLTELALALLFLNAARHAEEARGLLQRAGAGERARPRLLLGAAMLEALHSPARARATLDGAVELSGGQPEPLLLRARGALALQVGDAEAAVADLDAAIEREPANLRAHFLRAHALWLRSREAWEDPQWQRRALEDWKAALALDPGQFDHLLAAAPPALRREARLLLDPRGVASDPFAFLLTPRIRSHMRRRAQRARPPARGPLLRALLKAAAGGSPAELAPLYAAAREAAPRCPMVALEEARVWVGREDYAAAEQALARARELEAPSLQLDLLEADLFWLRGQGYEAAPRYEALVERDPLGVVGLCARANWLYAHEREDLGLQAAERALAEDPEFVPSLAIRATLLLRQEPPRLEEGRELCASGFALEGALDLRLVRSRMTAEALAMFFRPDGTRRADVDPRQLKRLVAAYERLLPLCAGTGILLDAVQYLVGVEGPHPWADRLDAWLAESIRRHPTLGMNHVLVGRRRVSAGAPKEQVLAAWRKAREVEPRIQFSEWTLDAYREAYPGPCPELAEFAGNTKPAGD
jgi:tetratricopeptide (TPR) repeat protein/predicted Ser/Thr protein kinase